MTSPWLAICVPSMETWMADMALSHSALTNRLTRLGIPHYTSNVQCSTISVARNQLVRRALAMEPKCTHLLWLDSDMHFCDTSFERLFAHDKDIAGAFYSRRVPPYGSAGEFLGTPDFQKGGLHKADFMPHGFCLMKREVYEKIPPAWYCEIYDPNRATKDDPLGWIGEDVNFTHKCRKAGFELWCDLDLTREIGHIGTVIFQTEIPQS